MNEFNKINEHNRAESPEINSAGQRPTKRYTNNHKPHRVVINLIIKR